MGRHQHCLPPGILGQTWGMRCSQTGQGGRVAPGPFLPSFSFSSIQMPQAGQVSTPTPATHQGQPPDPSSVPSMGSGRFYGQFQGTLCEVKRSASVSTGPPDTRSASTSPPDTELRGRQGTANAEVWRLERAWQGRPTGVIQPVSPNRKEDGVVEVRCAQRKSE